MTRNIDSSILTKLQSGELRPFHLMEAILDGYSYRITDCDVPLALPDDIIVSVEDVTLSIDGSTGGASNTALAALFTPTPGFKFSPIKYSKAKIVDKANISLSMLNNPEMLLAFVGGTPQGSQVIIRDVIVDDDYSIVGDTSFTIFEGTIDGWTTTETELKMAVVSAMSQWSQKALRVHGSSCQWKVFKGLNEDSPCMYSGSESSCDRTYKRCHQLGNTVNFGGFRWLPSIVDKELWWGND